MADFYSITEKDIQEMAIDVRSFYEGLNTEKTNLLDYGNKFGKCSISSQQKGNIFVSNFEVNLNKPISISSATQPLIGMYFNKKGRSFQKLNIKKKEYQKFDNQHCGFYFMNEGLVGQSVYEENLPTEFISFHFPPDFFKKLAQMYPDTLESSFKRFENGETFCLTEQTHPITHQMQQILSQIENANLLGNSSIMYLEAKVLELLALQFEFVKNTNSPQKKECIKTISDKEKIYEARSILLSDLSNTPSLRKLSLQVGINEKKLKQGFKEVFGTTVFGYLYQHKMYLAKQYLLDSSLLINEIALLCGYDYVSHFSTAFKRFWGCTPGEMRR
ncbi:AraC family transcriptional regulator [Weeksellaceae bacterium TAE3-ERU29]|nr:AraC family transcriptional regulator [Weeksellaceae bacterium TAE3-ERU29]